MDRKYGCNICGEGGEYETLTLDCPVFCRASIVLDAWQPLLHSDDSIASVGVLHPTHFHLEQKSSVNADVAIAAADVTEVTSQGMNVAVIFLLKRHGHRARLTQWQRLYTALAVGHVGAANGDQNCRAASAEARSCTSTRVVIRQRWGEELGSVSATCSHSAANISDGVHDALAALESGGSCMCKLKPLFRDAARCASVMQTFTCCTELKERGLSWRSALFVHLYIADMAHFAAANAGYAAVLPPVNPPARACVQLPLPDGVFAMVDVLVASRPEAPPPRILHVQSISQWAPACIGPYSQVRMPVHAAAAYNRAPVALRSRNPS